MYRVISNHDDCHPETCTCLDWQLVDPNNEVIKRSDDEVVLQSIADKMNAQRYYRLEG